LTSPQLSGALFRAHALEEMRARGISENQARAVLASPENVLPVRAGRVVAQRIVPRPGAGGGTGPYLLRVFVDVDRTPPQVVTAYWTSRVEKYRSRP
jgi:hypothetical protein